MNTLIGFAVGLLIGVVFGIIFTAVFVADERYENMIYYDMGYQDGANGRRYKDDFF